MDWGWLETFYCHAASPSSYVIYSYLHIRHSFLCVYIYIFCILYTLRLHVYIFNLLLLCKCVFIAYVFFLFWVYSKSSSDWKSFQTGGTSLTLFLAENIVVYRRLNRDVAFTLFVFLFSSKPPRLATSSLPPLNPKSNEPWHQ